MLRYSRQQWVLLSYWITTQHWITPVIWVQQCCRKCLCTRAFSGDLVSVRVCGICFFLLVSLRSANWVLWTVSFEPVFALPECRCLCLCILLDALTAHEHLQRPQWISCFFSMSATFSLKHCTSRNRASSPAVECLNTLRVETLRVHCLLYEPLDALSSRLDSRCIGPIVRIHLLFHRSDFVSRVSSEFISSITSPRAHSSVDLRSNSCDCWVLWELPANSLFYYLCADSRFCANKQ